jgi:hypothetical protein
MHDTHDRIETVSRQLFVALTSEEIQERGEQLAVKLREITVAYDGAAEDAKEWKAEIAHLETQANETAHVIRERRELRPVDVDIVPNAYGRVSEIRRDTGEIVIMRPISDRERQLSLPKIGAAAETGAA